MPRIYVIISLTIAAWAFTLWLGWLILSVLF